VALERLITQLRWRGDAGAEALMECFDDLTDYGRSQACVALGLLNAQASADKLWAFYQETVRDQRETYFIGALWGLIDLRDKRAADALADLLRDGRHFYELFAFLSMAGDARSVAPLMRRAMQMPKDDSLEPAMALLGIAHRIGRDALVAALDELTPHEEPREDLEAVADDVLSRPASLVEQYFALFYRGLTPDDLAQLFPKGS